MEVRRIQRRGQARNKWVQAMEDAVFGDLADNVMANALRMRQEHAALAEADTPKRTTLIDQVDEMGRFPTRRMRTRCQIYRSSTRLIAFSACPVCLSPMNVDWVKRNRTVGKCSRKGRRVESRKFIVCQTHCREDCSNEIYPDLDEDTFRKELPAKKVYKLGNSQGGGHWKNEMRK